MLYYSKKEKLEYAQIKLDEVAKLLKSSKSSDVDSAMEIFGRFLQFMQRNELLKCQDLWECYGILCKFKRRDMTRYQFLVYIYDLKTMIRRDQEKNKKELFTKTFQNILDNIDLFWENNDKTDWRIEEFSDDVNRIIVKCKK